MSYFWAFHLNIGDDLAIVSTSALYTSLLVKQLFSMAKVQQLNGLMKIISFFLDFIFSLMFSLLQFNHCVFFMCNLSAFKMLQHNYTYYEKSIQGSWCSNYWFRFYRKSGIIVKTKAMHTALEMKGISTKTICTVCYHLTIVVFCTIKE